MPSPAAIPGRLALSALLMLSLLLSACAALSPRTVPLDRRLAMMPTEDLPLERPVTIRWNEHQVPFVEAETDRDLAFALGLVHAHLRGGQMALLRRVSQGRLSESAGPFATEIDASLRRLGYGRAAAEVVDRFPPETRDWMEAFVAGLNLYQERAGRQPPEAGLLALEREPWTMEDLITIGRLAGTDVNWLVFFGLLPRRFAPDWPREWARAIDAGMAGAPLAGTDFGRSEQEAAILTDILSGLGRTGSNSLAVAPSHSRSGGALIASDPHLGLTLPNFWLLAGIRSPSFHAVGFMVPGLPFVALGRNPWLAWGGTNMRALSSDLYDVSKLPPEEIRTRRERIATRLWFDREVVIEETPFGPVISGSDFVPARPGERLALRWVGHEPTDEISAFLAANRARTGEGFRQALEGYGVSAQNMVWADVEGNIGLVRALTHPERADPFPDELVRDPRDPRSAWLGLENGADFPPVVNPPQGYVASANNRPRRLDRPVGLFFSPDDRVDRLDSLIEANGPLDLEALAALQRDSVSVPAAGMARGLAAQAAGAGLSSEDLAFFGELGRWDGDYGAEDAAPVAFEFALTSLAKGLYAEGAPPAVPGAKAGWSYLQRFLLPDLAALSAEARRELLLEAAEAGREGLRRFPAWGEAHRLTARHVLSNAPVVGGAFTYGDYPASGSRETVMKTAHGLVEGRHSAFYGSQARHLSDLSDPDANLFVLFGGQDAWLGSTTFADQITLWREGRYIEMPLTAEAVERGFLRVMELNIRE